MSRSRSTASTVPGNPVDLSVSGLPGGVTLTGGTTIAAGSDTTDLTFAIAANAPVGSTQFTLAATSAGVSAPPPDQGTFKVNAALTIGLTQSGDPIGGQPELTDQRYALLERYRLRRGQRGRSRDAHSRLPGRHRGAERLAERIKCLALTTFGC